ncbi:hypothetical protein SPRG_09245 [Saprolegnia parasitica CBS 223.65]|uniref:Uncharacterized protein n=1 Tax=Saprolegnia parasitica (strain CBS 223.65) TaxID=695850 RepID=A0A067C3K2_SAPPC|nr:hypothetical protein SPRG_09245 [Saprolegnia parasitica CBS 223.65]KDO25103.1 hypothetical protein SPRG_09245 [Saprolegnia parasitica CBS 223.65]|eukprot:XP_012204176.1 hypothetical protein SPRG_09245 [Saprolegnia parasitica CBS 223.65]
MSDEADVWSHGDEDQDDDDGDEDEAADDGEVDDDDGGANLFDAFEAFHLQASKRIAVLLQLTNDKIHAVSDAAHPTPCLTNADDDCYRHWSEGAPYLRVTGHGMLHPPLAAEELPACIPPVVVATKTHLPPRAVCLEVAGTAMLLSANEGLDCNDEEVFASDGLLDEPLYEHHLPDEASDSTNDLVSPRTSLVQQMHDAFLERLWLQTVIQCDPILRQVLQPLREPALPTPPPSPTPNPTPAKDDQDEFDLHGNVLTSVTCHVLPSTPRLATRRHYSPSRPHDHAAL